MSSNPLTSERHNDFVGGDASKGRIPGAEKATTGHHFVAVDLPRDQKRRADRAEEHLPPPTGRDAPPAGDVAPGTRTGTSGPLPSDILSHRAGVARQASPVHHITDPQNTSPLAPAPDSRTVVDSDPYATPVSAGDTLTGATSAEVHAGYGRPGQGMSSAEMHHDGQAHRKRQRNGAEQYGSHEFPREE